jgi:ketosteroid isomerase-like protein
MNRRSMLLSAPALVLVGCAAAQSREDLIKEVTDTELAFANTMAARDHAAFTSFIADEAVFLNGGKPLRGKAAVADFWKRFYTDARAPFSWKPDHVQVLDSGTLGYSTGPVFDPQGKQFARFYSTWRREPSGAWRIVFDDGCNFKCG